MAFKLCEAFVEFSARTEQASAGMKEIEQQAQKTAQTMENSMAGASASTFAFGGALAAVGTIAATRFAGGIVEGIKQGGDFGDVLDSGVSALLGTKSALDAAAEAQKRMNDAAERGAAVMNKLIDAQMKLQEHIKPSGPEFPGLKNSKQLESDLEAIRKNRNDAEKQLRDKGDIRQQIADAENFAKIAGSTFGPQQGLQAQTQLNALTARTPQLAGMGAKEAAAEAERLKHENKGLIDAADAAALAFKNESERLAEINTQMEFYNRVVGVATTSTEQLKQGLHAAVDPIKNVFGFLEKGAAMAEKGQQQIDALQRHQADEAEARAGVKALEAKFNPQIEALRLAEKGPQFMGIDELSRRANHAAGADNKTQIDVLRQQLDQQKQELENAKRVKELTENIRDGIKQMAAKAFGWGA